MGSLPETFRDFGILPDQLQPPAETVRGFFSPGRVAGQYLGTGILAALGLGLLLLCLLVMSWPLGLLGGAAALAGFGAFIYLGTRHDYRSVELTGNTLRAQHLYTGRILERSVSDIDRLLTIVYPAQSAETFVMEQLLGRVKGIEIRFRDGRSPLRILRADPAMTNAQELIEGVVYRMSQIGEIDAEVINFKGEPLLRSIHWEGAPPTKATMPVVNVLLACLIGFSLIFGMIFGFMGMQAQDRLLVSSQPPQELTLAALLAQGPGTNRHVTITDFQPAGYVVEEKNNKWSWVYVALDPAGAPTPEIKVILSSKSIKSEEELRAYLQTGRLTGACSATERRSWGAALGPELVKSNQGRPLKAAWELEELRNPPSEAFVNSVFYGAYGCFAAVIVLSAILFLKPA